MPTIPTSHDVIAFLESYDLETTKVISSETVTASTILNSIIIGGGVSYPSGTMIKFTVAAPAPLVLSQTYYAIAVDSTHIKVALTYADAIAGTAITLTTTGTAGITLSKMDYYFLSVDWIYNRMTNFVIPTMERIVGFPIGRTEQLTTYYSGQGKNLLILDHRNTISLDSIAYVLSSNYLWILTLDAVEVIKDLGILKAKRSVEQTAMTTPLFPKGDKNIKCTYTVGYTDVPAGLREAILYLTAEQALGFIGARTGGGGVGLQVSKTFGNRGMYSEVRNDLARQAHALMNKYISGVVGA